MLDRMRIARFIAGDQTQPRYAFVQTDKNDDKDYLVALDGYPLSGADVKPTGERFAVDSDGVRLLSPIIPSKVFGLAKNYEKHAEYMAGSVWKSVAPPEKMMIFSKPSTAVIGPDDPIVFPRWSKDLNYEPEVAVVIGRITRDVSVEDAMQSVLGFTCVNDVTARDAQKDDPMWTRAKGFDSACPLGPWIQTELNYEDAKISFTLNGEPVEDASGTTANLIHSIPEQIAFISSFSTLLPGDVILTGTPWATGSLKPGDETVVTVEGIGSLRNVVVAAQ
jgi:2-keto-4-pentenoate hydratase/2-oxohepta-3-ene-1,7-dioic acid hydratase in catechol pathway